MATDLNQLQYAHVARKFGMFVHFNMATFQDVEQGDPSASPNVFAPTTTDAGAMVDQWIATAKLAKMKDIALTVRHSDGFYLYDTAASAHKISNASWYETAGSPDFVALFTSKCRAAGILPILYVTSYDGYFISNNPGYTQADYLAYDTQALTEILSNYGNIAAVWYDTAGGYGGLPLTWPWGSKAAMDAFIKGQQADCLILNNSHTGDLSDSDIVLWENRTGNGAVPDGNTIYAEECDTIQSNNEWFWKTSNPTPRTAAAIYAEIVRCNAAKCTYRLNCPPDRSGFIPSAQVAVLTQVGKMIPLPGRLKLHRQ
jgi:alpha-L-fucosidase